MNYHIDIEQLNFEKMHHLLPAIIQEYHTREVLMLGYMDKAALLQTCDTKKITFYSRSKQRLWTKGETSGHNLELIEIAADCDKDALLLLAKANGPCCHLNTTSCFQVDPPPLKKEAGTQCQGDFLKGDANNRLQLEILNILDTVLEQRKQQPLSHSYSSQLFAEGIPRIAQKVGEEGVELALAGILNNAEHIKNEAADLIFHMLILLKQCDVDFNDVLIELAQRHQQHRQPHSKREV